VNLPFPTSWAKELARPSRPVRGICHDDDVPIRIVVVSTRLQRLGDEICVKSSEWTELRGTKTYWGKYELRLLTVHNCASKIAKSLVPEIALCIAERHWSETLVLVLLCWALAEDTLGGVFNKQSLLDLA
jgi:hypothetical protein